MNQAIKEALAILIRQGLIAVGTALGISGALTPVLGELTNYIVATLMVLVGAGYAQLVQLYKRGKLMQALEGAGMTEQQVAKMVRSSMIPTPKVTTPVDEVPSTAPREPL